MKKTVSIIFLSLLIALTAGCSGCPGKGMYDDSISELREQFLYGENQRFEVTLIGADGENRIPVEEAADLSHRFNYEFCCDINKRVPRVYIENGAVSEIADALI